jgi:acyl carrier protein
VRNEASGGTGAQTDPATVDDLTRRAVARLAPDPTARVRPEHLLVADLGYDSLRLVELTFLLEELFDLDSTAMDDAPPINSVADLQRYARRMLADGRATMPPPQAADDILTAD